MAQEKAWIIGVDSVVQWYDEMSYPEHPYFSVWTGKQLRFTFDGDSIEDGKEVLSYNLAMAEACKNSVLMTIRLHKMVPGGVLTDKTPYSASIDFRCIPVEEDNLAMYKLGGDAANQKIGELKAELAAMKSKKPKGIMGYLEPFLENEEVQAQVAGGIMNVLTGLAGKILTPKGAQPVIQQAADHQGAVMAGVDNMNITEEDQLNHDLKRLEEKDPKILDHLTKLADLAQSNPTLFKMLINNLEGMK